VLHHGSERCCVRVAVSCVDVESCHRLLKGAAMICAYVSVWVASRRRVHGKLMKDAAAKNRVATDGVDLEIHLVRHGIKRTSLSGASTVDRRCSSVHTMIDCLVEVRMIRN